MTKLPDSLASFLKNGGVAIMPTDTVYGLVCSALSPKAVNDMYKIKKREGKPGTVLAGNLEQLIGMGLDAKDLTLAAVHWPDAVSVVVVAPESLNYLHMGKNSLAVRIPKPRWLRELLLKTGPLATTSANLPGQSPVSTIAAAKEVFGRSVKTYIDGGDLSDRQPSGIIKIDRSGRVHKLR